MHGLKWPIHSARIVLYSMEEWTAAAAFLACPMRVELIGHFKPCMTEIYLHIDARMADYIRTHPYGRASPESSCMTEQEQVPFSRGGTGQSGRDPRRSELYNKK